MKKRIRKFAYVACNGGEHNHNCQYGCIGCGACVEACRKNAVSINAQGVAEIDRDNCVGCRLCEKACQQQIIHMHNVGEPFLVRCSNRDMGAPAIQIEDNCAVIYEADCLSCGNCVVKCPRNAIVDIREFIKK